MIPRTEDKILEDLRLVGKAYETTQNLLHRELTWARVRSADEEKQQKHAALLEAYPEGSCGSCTNWIPDLWQRDHNQGVCGHPVADSSILSKRSRINCSYWSVKGHPSPSVSKQKCGDCMHWQLLEKSSGEGKCYSSRRVRHSCYANHDAHNCKQFRRGRVRAIMDAPVPVKKCRDCKYWKSLAGTMMGDCSGKPISGHRQGCGHWEAPEKEPEHAGRNCAHWCQLEYKPQWGLCRDMSQPFSCTAGQVHCSIWQEKEEPEHTCKTCHFWKQMELVERAGQCGSLDRIACYPDATLTTRPSRFDCKFWFQLKEEE